MSAALGLMFACLLSVVSCGALPIARADGGAPNLAYAVGAGAGGQDLAVIDISQRRETRHLTIGGAPAAVVLSPDSRFAYVSQRALDRVAVVDARAFKVIQTIAVGRQPTALAFDATQSLLYVANTGSNTISVVNPATASVIRTVATGVAPSGLAIATASSGITVYNDEELYVADSGSAAISVISLRLQRVIATIPTPGDPETVVVPNAGGVAYATTSEGAVLALSLSATRLLGVLWRRAGARLGVMDYNAVTGAIFVPDAATDTVVELTPAADSGARAPAFPNEPARTLAFPGGPRALAITFEGAVGFVAEQQTGVVAMFDATTRRPLGEITVGGSPLAVVTGAYPPLLTQQNATLVNGLAFAAIAVVIIAALVAFVWAGIRLNTGEE